MRIRKVRTFSLGVVTTIVLGALVSPGAHAQGFTAEQAASGKATFEKNCQQCHRADLTGGGGFPALTGERFMSSWGNQTAGDLFNFISNRMPFDRPGQLAKGEYVNIVAYWLSFHNHAPGSEPLTDDANQLEGIVLQP